jgi:RNA polymerase sigma-70 factor (ECF subfamily)
VDESRLIACVLAGDRSAARALYEAHAPRVHRLCYRLTGDQDLAEECTQETFIQAFRKLDRFRGDSALSSWLYRVAVRATLTNLRRVRRWRERETALARAEELPARQEADPDLKSRLARAIDDLPEKFRVVVILHDVEGYTHSEIAAMLGAPEGTCKTRLMHARARLREELADFAAD